MLCHSSGCVVLVVSTGELLEVFVPDSNRTVESAGGNLPLRDEVVEGANADRQLLRGALAVVEYSGDDFHSNSILRCRCQFVKSYGKISAERERVSPGTRGTQRFQKSAQQALERVRIPGPQQ